MRGLKESAVAFAFGLLLLTWHPILRPLIGELGLISAAVANPGGSTQLEETKKSWGRRRLQEFRRGICRLRSFKGNSQERAAAFASEVDRVKARFTDSTARALGLPELEPRDIKVGGASLMFKLGAEQYIYSCTIDDDTPPADLLPEVATCSDANNLNRQIADLLETVGGAYPEAGKLECPPHLENRPEEGGRRCVNPCPDDRPHYVILGGWPVREDEEIPDECQPCPDEFPTYSKDKMDCVDNAGCTHHEGHHKTPEGRFKCGRDCPPGWKSIKSGLCQEDLAKACAYCEQVIKALETWQLQIPDSGQKSSNSPKAGGERQNCDRKVVQEIFDEYKSLRLAAARGNQQECRKKQSTPRVVPVDQITSTLLLSTPCVGTMVGNGLNDMSVKAVVDYGCSLPRKWYDPPQFGSELDSVLSQY